MKGQLSAREAPPRLSAASVILGIVAGYVVSILAAGLLGLLMFRLTIPDPTVTSVMGIVAHLSMLAGGVYGARHAGNLGWAHGAFIGAGFVAVGILLGSIISPVGPTLPSALGRVGLGSLLGAIGGTIGVNLNCRC
ncbi:MAG TPA: TIGR04086 family membrane protein [Bacillota bacterium]|nr:TIGR04086 family membrane protein [Bacillota bacterium]